MTLLWFRQDLRIDDNSAVAAAIERGAPIVPVLIWAPQEEGNWQPGGATKWWLHHALADLGAQFAEIGLRLFMPHPYHPSDAGTIAKPPRTLNPCTAPCFLQAVRRACGGLGWLPARVSPAPRTLQRGHTDQRSGIELHASSYAVHVTGFS